MTIKNITTTQIAIIAFVLAVFLAIINSCHTNPALGQKRRDLPELSPLSFQCETMAKEFTYKGHTIVRFDCSGSYWAIHDKSFCEKCQKECK